MNPIARYLFALSAMIVAYTVYAKLAVPFLEGPPRSIQRPEVAIDTSVDSDQLDKSHLQYLVPENSWELGPCKTLLTPQGTVYFDYWEPVDDKGTYRLVPFTIVMNDPVNRMQSAPPLAAGEKVPSPIVLSALKGAQLKFNRPLTARSGNEEIEMESAQLDGQVTLFRPANPENKEEKLQVATSNIQINRQQVFTLDDVYFSIGDHHGSGRNLSIKLAHGSGTEAPSNGFSNVEGVEQLELAYVSELVLKPTTGNVFSPSLNREESEPVVEGGLSLSNQKTPLRLSCDGPFVFRMSEKRAWFRDNVKVTQQNGFGDNLQCDSLQIEFAKTDGKATSVKSLIAIGSTDRPAVIDAISRQTKIVGQELNFDVPNSIVKAAGTRPVFVRSPKLVFEAPNLTYRLGEQGKLGALDAAGPGRMRGVSSNSKRSFRVDWANRLTTRDIDPERLQIDIDQDAKVQFDQNNGIAADTLSLIVWQMPAVDSTVKKPRWQYFPSRLTSIGNVNIDTEELEGAASEFVANWPRPTEKQLSTVKHSVSFRRQQDAGISIQSLPAKGLARPEKNGQRPMRFSGTKVFANVAGDMENLTIRDLTVDGMMSLESFATDRRPFAVSGASMKLVPQGEELYRVTIDGSPSRPAEFKTDGFAMAGKDLHLDQAANTVWMQGAGELKIDAKMPTSVSQQSDGQLPDLESATVKWDGGMVFDGSKIYFEHNVDLDANRRPRENGQRSVTKTNSEAVTIELTESIRFEKIEEQRAGKSKRNRPQIRKMVFVGKVDEQRRAFQFAGHTKEGNSTVEKEVVIQNATFDAQGKLIGLQKLLVPTATADAVSGDILTSGPGAAISYQISDGKNGNRLTGFTRDKSTEGKSGPELSCVHCRFDGQLVANSERGTMAIDRNTRSAWSVVKSFDDTIDPDRPDQLPVGAAVLKSDVLKFAQWTPRNGEPRQEMRAEGNTSIRSQLFEAVANRLTYNDDTDILVIESNPPASAKLMRKTNPNAEPETMLASKIMYRLSDQSYTVSDIRSIDAKLPARKK